MSPHETPTSSPSTTWWSIRSRGTEFSAPWTRCRFSVDKGKTLAIVGESGCGKSTIAKAIVRLLTPTSGRIVLDGNRHRADVGEGAAPLPLRVQMVFQDPYGSLDPHLTALDIVAEPLRLRVFGSKAERAQGAAELIDQVGLPHLGAPPAPGEFSGGQRQRIGIARALASDPRLLVCDEATSALDVSVQAQVLELLRVHPAGHRHHLRLHLAQPRRGPGDQRYRGGDVAGAVWSNPASPQTCSPNRPRPVHPALRAAALDPTTMVGIKPRHIVSRPASPTQKAGAPA